MQNKVILGLVLLLALAVIGIFFFNNRASAPASLNHALQNEETPPADAGEGGDEFVQTAEEFIVRYTPEGFSPETVEVPRGSIVKFVNESGSPMWVASAIHPTHSLYPQKSSTDCLGSSFDACNVTEDGSSWSFTFTEVGSWGYHDHVRANKRGTIVVK